MMNIFDCHLHIVDKRFPLVPNTGFLPEPFTVDDYLERVASLGVTGGAVVSGSFQAYDQTYLLDALNRLGPSFVGVTQAPYTISDQEILDLNAAGVRAVRFNLKRGGSEDIKHLQEVALRVHDLCGWHVELYIDSRALEELYPLLTTLPKISIDHLGLSKEGFATLLKLVEQGAHVKATGFGRVDFEVADALKRIVNVNPDALMFGTDLPCTRAPRPFRREDLDLITSQFNQEVIDKILYQNAIELYRPTRL